MDKTKLRRVVAGIAILTLGAMAPFGLASTSEASVASDAVLPFHGHELGEADAVEPLWSYSYRVDPAALKAHFRATGLVEFATDSATTLAVAGEETALFTSRNIYEWSESGMTKVGEYTSIPLHGQLVGVEDSNAALLLGEWGIYGAIRTGDGDYEFEPRLEGADFVQVVSFYPPLGGVGEPVAELDLPGVADDVAIPLHTISTTTISRVWIQGDQATENAKANWLDLATSGFNKHKNMWLTTPQVLIDLRIDAMGKITGWNISSSASCSQTGTNYVNYLTWYFNTFAGPWWHQAHNFWSGYGWSGSGGCALQDEVGYANPEAVAISPMADIGTAYDVDSEHHRGISSGHELGHVYGSGHNSEKNALGKYEIMRSDPTTPLNSMDFFFGTNSRNDVHCMFYHSDPTPPC
jgi:hypothetical protein